MVCLKQQLTNLFNEKICSFQLQLKQQSIVSLADSAVHISAVSDGDGLTVLQWRMKPGMNMRDPEDEIRATGTKYGVIQLERKGKKITMRVAKKEGDPFETVGEHAMDLPNEILAGIFICSHNPDVIEQAKAWNIQVKQ